MNECETNVSLKRRKDVKTLATEFVGIDLSQHKYGSFKKI